MIPKKRRESKHPKELKIKTVDRIVNKGESLINVANDIKVSVHTIGYWIKTLSGAKRKSPITKQYSESERSHATDLLKSKCISDVANQTGMSHAFLQKQAREYGITIKRANDLTSKDGDKTLLWISINYSRHEPWRALAQQWISEQEGGIGHKLKALSVFVIEYLEKTLGPLGKDTDPKSLLSKSNSYPDFFDSCMKARAEDTRVIYNNGVHEFLSWVLLTQFSVADDYGRLLVPSEFRNPVISLSREKKAGPSESVRSPLPYGYIEELRSMIAQGPNFKDWTWTQNSLGYFSNNAGRAGPDWFEVNQSIIDNEDPDCVWRERTRLHKQSGKLTKCYEMWSPVRWMALLTKLTLPLRTVQVRLLDSGEADTFIYKITGEWGKNTNRLKEGDTRKPHQCGVFRKPSVNSSSSSSSNANTPASLLYINTNKTADINKSGANKGYTMPWSSTGPLHGNPFYWLAKLRDWQSKFNPPMRRVSWSELDSSRLEVKSDIQLSSYEDSTFLFRTPELLEHEHLPITNGSLETPWYNLLEEFQNRLAKRNETHADGSRIELVETERNKGGKKTVRTHFPLHSLRVSLITALALEGNVPFPILQKIVGHSRLIMTLYYTKPGASFVGQVLDDALKKLESTKGASIVSFLKNTEYDSLVQNAIANSSTAVAIAIPEHQASRNPAGWGPMHHGLCLVGGNTTNSGTNGSVGGCHNGGPNLGSDLFPNHGAVPGGARNCVRCRWFVTDAAYIPALASHLNNVFYHYDEARNSCVKLDEELGSLRAIRSECETACTEFLDMPKMRDVERRYESAMQKFSELAEDAAACTNLIRRCEDSLALSPPGKNALVARGSIVDIKSMVEEVDSELLQLSGVCKSTEIYPDINPGKAVFRRSQLLDAALLRDGIKPIFLTLSEEEQLRLGNLFMAKISREFNPGNPSIGERRAISLIDAKESLSMNLGIGIESLTRDVLPLASQVQNKISKE